MFILLVISVFSGAIGIIAILPKPSNPPSVGISITPYFSREYANGYDDENISIYYKNNKVSSINKSFFEIRNIGTEAITKSMFDKPFIVDLSEQDIKIIDAYAVDANDDFIREDISNPEITEDNKILVNNFLLNQGEYFNFLIVTDKPIEKFKLSYKIEGMKSAALMQVIAEIDPDEQKKYIRFFTVVGIVLLILFLAVIIPVIFYKLKHKRNIYRLKRKYDNISDDDAKILANTSAEEVKEMQLLIKQYQTVHNKYALQGKKRGHQ